MSNSPHMPEPLLIISSCEDRHQAERIAHALVEERLAACVNIVPGMTSVYRWEGAVQTASECLLLIKTTVERARMVEDRVAQLHSYDTPELVRVPVAGGSQRYLTWLIAAVAEGEAYAGPEHIS